MRRLSLEIQQPSLCRSSEGELTVSRSLRSLGLTYGGAHHVHKPADCNATLRAASNFIKKS